jgi:type VI secretion system protein ImpE
MNATELYRAGRLDDAIQALGAALRDDPADAQRRTFLFELLCFAGQYDRAEKQLDILADGGPEAEIGTLVYRGALHAERTRQEMFHENRLPDGGPAARPVGVTLNGRPVEEFADADPRIGARLEVLAAGQYLWIPLQHIESIRMEPPRQLRDLLWAPALVRTGPAFRGMDLGEVLIPVLTPLAWRHPDAEVRLGRVSDWTEGEDGIEVPVGQKLFVADGEEIPILDIRELIVTPTPAAEEEEEVPNVVA